MIPFLLTLVSEHQCQSKFENPNLHTDLHRVTKVPLISGKLKSCTKKSFQRAAVIPTKTLLSSTKADFLLYVTRALHLNLFISSSNQLYRFLHTI